MTDEAMVEAVARALAEAQGENPDERCRSLLLEQGTPLWAEFRDDARAAIRAIAPLLIERCAEVAKRHAEEHARSLDACSAADVDAFWWRLKGHVDAGEDIAEDIRALIQKEASDGER